MGQKNMNKLIQTLESKQNKTAKTENGARSNFSSLSFCVDLFGSLAAMRARSDSEIISAFTKAYAENPLKAMKILFHARDIRGGSGERNVFRVITKYLANNHGNVILKNLSLFGEYGRLDDLVELIDTDIRTEVLDFISNKVVEDIHSDSPSLLFKWLPSCNASSKETIRKAGIIRKHLGWTEKDYRKTLSAMRAKLKVLEKQLCQGEWKKIDFEKVPSVAGLKYRKAFFRNAEEEYKSYLSSVEKGEKQIKASTLYPYDIVRAVRSGGDRTLDAQWKALPNYVEPFNGLVVCDTSGSMGNSGYYSGDRNQVVPIDVALSLSIYIAERNSTSWKNYFITFSERPTLQKVVGSTISEKVSNLSRADWDQSTNLQAVFDLILDRAIKEKLSEDEMPKMIMIISDMAYNTACSSNKRTNLEQITKKYKNAGYERPNLVFWNVNASGKQTPVTVSDEGTCLVSGCSPSILKSVLSGKIVSPIDVMNETIESERYSAVQI